MFDIIRGVEKKSMILVISPLIALMEDQVATIHSFGTSAVYVSDVMMTKDKERIREGKFQVILMSPEALFSGTTWKHTLSTNIFRENLVGMIVDEAHCVKKW